MADHANRKRVGRRSLIKGIGASGIALVAGCSGDGGDATTTPDDDGTDAGNGEDTATSAPTESEALFDLEAIAPDGVVSEGPFGEEAAAADEVALTDDEESELQDGDWTIEVVFHYREDTWVTLQEQAITERCSELGINITGIHYAEFGPETQSDILETVAQKEPVDGILSIPTDIEATEEAYRTVADAGKEIVFMDNVPANFEHPDEYAGVVTADSRGMGMIGARMIESLVDGGKVLMLEHDVPFYVTNERFVGARDVLQENDDFDVEIVGFTDEGDVLSIAQNALTANPDTAALWAPWIDPPGAQAIQAIDEQGMDIPVTSCDLGERSGILMAEGDYLKGVGPQDPLAQGRAEVNMIAKSFLDQETPPFVALPSRPVARQNLLEMYPELVGEEPPESITQHFE